MRKLRIGIITDETDAQLVGFGTYTLELTRHILEQDRKNEYFLIHRRKESHPIYGMAKEIIVSYNPAFPFSTVRNFITLPFALRKYRLDIVHHMTITGPFLFRPFMNYKAVETIHELLTVVYPECFEPPVRMVFRWLLPGIARNSDFIFTAGEGWKREIMKRYGIKEDRIGVIYPGSDPSFRPMDRRKCRAFLKKKYGLKEPFLLFVSTLEAKKNIPALIRAFSILKSRGRPHKLVLVGRRGYKFDMVAKAVRELRLEADVIMPGYVPFEDLPSFYNACEAFVMPAFDSFNLTAVDAMKCGCAIVASNGGGAREGFGDCALLVDVADAEGYAAALARIMDEKNLARELGKRALAWSERFSWERAAGQTIAVYERLGAFE